MSLSCTISEINSDFSQKSQILAIPLFLTPTEGVSLELGTNARGQKSRMMRLPEGQKSFKTGLAI